MKLVKFVELLGQCLALLYQISNAQQILLYWLYHMWWIQQGYLAHIWVGWFSEVIRPQSNLILKNTQDLQICHLAYLWCRWICVVFFFFNFLPELFFFTELPKKESGSTKLSLTAKNGHFGGYTDHPYVLVFFFLCTLLLWYYRLCLCICIYCLSYVVLMAIYFIHMSRMGICVTHTDICYIHVSHISIRICVAIQVSAVSSLSIVYMNFDEKPHFVSRRIDV